MFVHHVIADHDHLRFARIQRFERGVAGVDHQIAARQGQPRHQPGDIGHRQNRAFVNVAGPVQQVQRDCCIALGCGGGQRRCNHRRVIGPGNGQGQGVGNRGSAIRHIKGEFQHRFIAQSQRLENRQIQLQNIPRQGESNIRPAAQHQVLHRQHIAGVHITGPRQQRYEMGAAILVCGVGQGGDHRRIVAARHGQGDAARGRAIGIAQAVVKGFNRGFARGQRFEIPRRIV